MTVAQSLVVHASTRADRIMHGARALCSALVSALGGDDPPMVAKIDATGANRTRVTPNTLSATAAWSPMGRRSRAR